MGFVQWRKSRFSRTGYSSWYLKNSSQTLIKMRGREEDLPVSSSDDKLLIPSNIIRSTSPILWVNHNRRSETIGILSIKMTVNPISTGLSGRIDCVIECVAIGDGTLVDTGSTVIPVGVVEVHAVRVKGCADGVVA